MFHGLSKKVSKVGKRKIMSNFTPASINYSILARVAFNKLKKERSENGKQEK